MMSVDEVLHYVRAENNALRHERNAAQQRAEQAERERDEARVLLSRIRAITTASLSPLDWTPKTGAEIAKDLEGKPAILPPDFDVNAAPTVKADAGDEPTLSEMAVIARNIWIANNPFSAANNEYSYNRELNLFSAVGRIIDLLDAMIKRGAS